MDRYDHLIVGGGLAAASAVEGIREHDEDGRVLVLCDEPEPPYHRPPLSKEFLQAPGAGRELLHVKPEGWFDEQAGVELRTGVRVVEVEARERVVKTRDGDEIGGDRLLLATGGRPRTLDVEGADLEGVHTLRTVEDSEALREAAREAEHVLLVGAGFIGMELAASFHELDVVPVVVELQDRVWARMLPPELSRFVQDYYEERGVGFRLESSVDGFRGDGRLEGAVLDDGTRLPCDIAVVGVGIEPAQELASDAGLAVKDGIVVDAKGETSHGYIYAAGDVARFPDPVFGDLTRVEHWDHAKAHGKLVGRNMAGDGQPYDHLSYFFTEAFDLSINVFGRPADVDRTLTRGEVGSEGAVVYCGRDGRLCATILVNDHDAMEECRELVRRRPSMEEVEAMLEDAGSDTAGVGG